MVKINITKDLESHIKDVESNKILIRGEFGSGKTTMVDEFLKKYKDEGKVLEINASDLREGTPIAETILKKYISKIRTFFWNNESIFILFKSALSLFVILSTFLSSFFIVSSINTSIYFLFIPVFISVIYFTGLFFFSFGVADIKFLSKKLKKFEFVVIDDLNRIDNLSIKRELLSTIDRLVSNQEKIKSITCFILIESLDYSYLDVDSELKYFDQVFYKKADDEELKELILKSKIIENNLNNIFIQLVISKGNFRLAREFKDLLIKFENNIIHWGDYNKIFKITDVICMAYLITFDHNLLLKINQNINDGNKIINNKNIWLLEESEDTVRQNFNPDRGEPIFKKVYFTKDDRFIKYKGYFYDCVNNSDLISLSDHSNFMLNIFENIKHFKDINLNYLQINLNEFIEKLKTNKIIIQFFDLNYIFQVLINNGDIKKNYSSSFKEIQDYIESNYIEENKLRNYRLAFSPIKENPDWFLTENKNQSIKKFNLLLKNNFELENFTPNSGPNLTDLRSIITYGNILKNKIAFEERNLMSIENSKLEKFIPYITYDEFFIPEILISEIETNDLELTKFMKCLVIMNGIRSAEVVAYLGMMNPKISFDKVNLIFKWFEKKFGFLLDFAYEKVSTLVLQEEERLFKIKNEIEIRIGEYPKIEDEVMKRIRDIESLFTEKKWPKNFKIHSNWVHLK